jgi:hypothetical protein
MVATVDSSKLTADDEAAAHLDEKAAAIAEEIADWLRSHAADYGVELLRIRLRHWQSIEDPRSHDLVIEVRVSGSAEQALEFGGAASEVLGRRVMRDPSPAAELLCIETRWL